MFTVFSVSILIITISRSAALPPWFPPPSQCESSHGPAPTFPGPVPPLPPLPNQYSMKVEANIIQKGWTTEVEEHYDKVNERASIALTFNGSTTISVFNFNAGERYDVYPNGSCYAAPAKMDYFGFVKNKQKKGERPAMATINDVFKFGSGFNETYMGKTVVRGIPVNHWTSCQEWKRYGAKFQLDYYFTDPDFYTASGSQQIPVRAVLNGSANNVGMHSESLKGSHRFEHIYDFFSVRPGPPTNEEVFQVPPGVICHGREDTKPLPQLPDTFEMHMETIIPDKGRHPEPAYLRYDWPNKLLETGVRMAVPQRWNKRRAHWQKKMNGKDSDTSSFSRPTTGGSSHSGSGNANGDDDEPMTIASMSTVQDFNAGVVYVLDKMNMSCVAFPMPEDTFKVGMSHGVNLLHIGSRQKANPGREGFTYQGQKYMRQMLVEVWGEEVDGLTQELYFLAQHDYSRSRSYTRRSRSTSNGTSSRSPWSGSRSNGTSSRWRGSSSNGTSPRWSGSRSNGTSLSWPGSRSNGTNSRWPGSRSNGTSPRSPWSGARSNATSSRWRGSLSNGTSSSSSWSRPQPTKARVTKSPAPYPVLVGMYMRNSTAIRTDASLVDLFRDVFRPYKPDAMQWTGMASSSPSPVGPDPVAHRRGWHQRSRGDQIAWGMQMMRLMDTIQKHKLVNVYNYKPLHTESSNFQVSLCYPDHQVSQMMAVVKANYDDDVMQNFAAFSNNLRQALAEAASVSLLQIANLVPMPMVHDTSVNNLTIVTFSLLGRPITTATRQLSLDQAKKNLATAITSRGVVFSVHYPLETKSFMVEKNLFFPDYDRLESNGMSPQGGAGHSGHDSGDEGHEGMSLPMSPKGKRMGGASLPLGGSKHNKHNDDTSGYSGSEVVGIAFGTLVLGIVVALAGGYVFYRTRARRGDSNVPYQMTS